MAGVSVKLGVSGVAQFKQDINTANQQIKTMNADLALVEKQFRATGNAEAYMQTKTQLLKAKLEEQKTVLSTAEAALKSMKDNGVTAASSAFQDMQRKIIAAKGDILDTEQQLKAVESGGEAAGKGVGTMNDQLKEIGKGVSFENVTNGIKNITDNLEKGARAAVNLGKKIIASAKGSTGWADEILTMSTKYGIDVDTLQRMQKAAEYIDTDVDTILNAKGRLAKNQGNLMDVLGIDTAGMSVDEAFWKAGEAIMGMADSFEQEEAAQKIFGRSWHDLVPLFAAGQEEYSRVLSEQNTLSEEQVKALGQADDAIKKVEQSVEDLKNQFWAENADKLTAMMEWIVDNKEGVVAALTAIGAAFAGLKIVEIATNIGKVVNAFKTLGLVSGGGAATGGGLTASAGKIAAGLGGTSALVPLGVLGAGILPAIIANNADRSNAAAKQASRVMHANALGGTEGWFLERAANALGIQANGMWGDYAAIESLLMGLNSQSGIQKSQLHNLLAGSTAGGNDTWNELMRLWGGEEMDMGRMTEILESVTDAYDRMAQQAEETERASDSNTDATDKMADAASKLPKEVASAVRGAVSGLHVVLDGGAMTQVVGQVLAGAVENG